MSVFCGLCACTSWFLSKNSNVLRSFMLQGPYSKHQAHIEAKRATSKRAMQTSTSTNRPECNPSPIHDCWNIKEDRSGICLPPTSLAASSSFQRGCQSSVLRDAPPAVTATPVGHTTTSGRGIPKEGTIDNDAFIHAERDSCVERRRRMIN